MTINIKEKYWPLVLFLTIGVTVACRFQFQHPHLVKKLKESNKEFAFDIFQNVIVARNDNILISTLEITSVIGTLTMAVRGNSANQIKNVFKVLKVDGEIGINEAISDVFNSLCIPTPFEAIYISNQPPHQSTTSSAPTAYYNITIYVFNGIFIHNSPYINVRTTYVTSTRHYYNTTIKQLDIAQNINKTEQLINDYTHGATNGKLAPFNLSLKVTPPQLLFTSAIYFHAKWEEGFNTKYTRPWQFNASPTETILVSMMGKESEIPYTNRLDFRCRMIQLNYYKQRLAMYIILPYEIDGVQHIERYITSLKFHSMVASLRPTNIVLRLPKFKLQQTTELSQIMKTMGYTDIFNNETADLRGMFSRANRIAVSEIIHAAAMEVSEEGTKMLETQLKNRVEHPVEFTIDHPFIFIIEDQLSGLILFMGRMIRPQQINFDEKLTIHN
ncbi:Serpin peptidase inhibitor, clade B (Ovalbumin), member [Chamberlinius hualienensis]